MDPAPIRPEGNFFEQLSNNRHKHQPRAPALLAAAHNFAPLTQTIPAWTMGVLVPNNFVNLDIALF